MLRVFGPGCICFEAKELGFLGFGVDEEIVAKGGNAEVLLSFGVQVKFAGGGGEDLGDQDGGVGLETIGWQDLVAVDRDVRIERGSGVWGEDAGFSENITFAAGRQAGELELGVAGYDHVAVGGAGSGKDDAVEEFVFIGGVGFDFEIGLETENWEGLGQRGGGHRGIVAAIIWKRSLPIWSSTTVSQNPNPRGLFLALGPLAPPLPRW